MGLAIDFSLKLVLAIIIITAIGVLLTTQVDKAIDFLVGGLIE